jgi:2'-5' RNA ligase
MQHGSFMYYIAIVAESPVAEDVQRFKEEMREEFGCIAAMKSPAHITLIAPFYFSKGLSKILIDTVHQFDTDMQPFEIRVEGFGHFRRDVLFVQPVENALLMQLQEKTVSYFSALLGDKVSSKRNFHPHLTIANRDLKSEDFDKALSLFKDRPYSAAWTVKDICLMRHNGKQWEIAERRALSKAH